MSSHLLEYQWLCDSGKIWYMLDRAVDEILKVYQKNYKNVYWRSLQFAELLVLIVFIDNIHW